MRGPCSGLPEVILMEAVEAVTQHNPGASLESCLLLLAAAVQWPSSVCKPQVLAQDAEFEGNLSCAACFWLCAVAGLEHT